MRNKIIKFVKESVEWLQEEQEGCCTYKLDDHLAICVGWSAGYGEQEQDYVIQAKDNFDFGINVGIKVWTSDYMRTDYDWINFPYYEDGDVLDMGVSIAPNDNYELIVNDLLKWYDKVKDLILNDDGKIIEEAV
jgi:hypothetical protein